MKRIYLLLALVLMLAAGNVYAHDAGDLMLGIEPQIGIAIPSIGLMSAYEMFPGIDFSMRATVDYYFTDFLSLGVGLGYSCNYHIFLGDSSSSGVDGAVYSIPIIGWIILLGDIAASLEAVINPDGTYFASYITIPFGLRLSAKAFTLGAGATANLPIYGGGEIHFEDETVTFKLLPYLGWYADIGFDFSGRKNRKNGFGILFRINGTFTEEIAEPSDLSFNDFRFFSTALIFKASLELANRPIGGKKE